MGNNKGLRYDWWKDDNMRNFFNSKGASYTKLMELVIPKRNLYKMFPERGTDFPFL